MRFLHSADWHLDAPFASMEEEEASAQREMLRQLPWRLCDYVNEAGIHLVLLSGDLFDGEHPAPETIKAVSDALGQMKARVFIAPGNHDAAPSLWEQVRWPENVTIFRRSAMEMVVMEGIAIHGAAFTAPEQHESLLSGFRVPQDGLVHIGLLHGEIAGESRYNPLRPGDIAASGLHYLAIGHIHAAGQVLYGDTLTAWPGCPQGRGFDETGEKGFYEGDVDDDGVVTLRFVPFAKGRFWAVTVDVTGEDVLQAVQNALPAHTSQDWLRLTVTGEAEDTAVLGALSAEFASFELRDRTRRPQDLWSACAEDSLRGAFLRGLKERQAAAATEAEKNRITMAARFGLAALEGREMPLFRSPQRAETPAQAPAQKEN